MKDEKNITQNNSVETAKKVAATVGNVGKVAVAGTLIAGHCILSVIGAILCVVTSQD